MGTHGAPTPPATPARSRAGTAESISTSTSTLTSRSASISGTSIQSGPDITYFSAKETDYELVADSKLGSGRFSSVFLARRIPPHTSSQACGEPLTPPVTPTIPTQRRTSLPLPELLAVKKPADKASLRALLDEARVLSYLTRCPNNRYHIVPFHGLDARNDSIILTALPHTLSDLITALEPLPLPNRTQTIISLLPPLVRSLSHSLAWLHAQSTIHADIKPANILLHPVFPSAETPSILTTHWHPVYADFTSSICALPGTHATQGGQTYDFAAPELMRTPYPPPTAKSDVYALAITVLTIILGETPFARFEGNRTLKLAAVREGDVLGLVGREERLKDVVRGLAPQLDLLEVLRCALTHDVERRVGADMWAGLWPGSGV